MQTDKAEPWETGPGMEFQGDQAAREGSADGVMLEGGTGWGTVSQAEETARVTS